MHPKRFHKTKSRHHMAKNEKSIYKKDIETHEKNTFIHVLQHRTQYWREMILPITKTSNTVAKNFLYFKSKGLVIFHFSTRPIIEAPGLSTHEIEAFSCRLSKAEFQPVWAQAAQTGLSSVNWPGQNKLSIPDLKWKWKFLATVFGVYVIVNIISL